MPVLFVALPPMVARFLSAAVQQKPDLELIGTLDTMTELTLAAGREKPALVFVGGEVDLGTTDLDSLFRTTAVSLVAQVSTSGKLVQVHSKSGEGWELEAHTAPELLSAVLRILAA
jgi:hypothetical protein